MADKKYYESLDKHQLITFLLNMKLVEETLRDRLFLLSGCRDFGNSDGMDGSCVECGYDNPALQYRCLEFGNAYREYVKNKLKMSEHKEKKEEPKYEGVEF